MKSFNALKGGREQGLKGKKQGHWGDTDTTTGIATFCKIEIMAGPETDTQFHFTGIALMILYFKLRSKKTPAVKAT
ncbi:unnamed protein product [Nyctereutes procyonoides]|uniref:(raccoon dog) hypothetical protein n=1 Tax=Nyctereutes procyonoides TaxID=34880 RepID=A0A811ZPG6_NYCPR|nr:unnamed protein product [Nyctereutes procyonoides]